MTRRKRMPAIFIGHGSPMNAIEDNEFSAAWREAALRFPKPEAVLCVSAHWETEGVRLTTAAHPGVIHDFYGFPPELYAVRYPALGSPELAARTAEALRGHDVGGYPERGLDHGAWSVLRRMYPDADVPVVQLSLNSARPGEFHYRAGRELRKLREQGILVLGSGNIVHNLRLYDFYDDTPYPWALDFDAEAVRDIMEHRHKALTAFRDRKVAGPAIPTPEHYLPLLYVLGAREEGEDARIFCRKTLVSLSMTSVAFGLGEENRGNKN